MTTTATVPALAVDSLTVSQLFVLIVVITFAIIMCGVLVQKCLVPMCKDKKVASATDEEEEDEKLHICCKIGWIPGNCWGRRQTYDTMLEIEDPEGDEEWLMHSS